MHSCTHPQTQFGQNVGVVGSFNGWDVSAPLALNWTHGSVWRGEAELAAGWVWASATCPSVTHLRSASSCLAQHTAELHAFLCWICSTATPVPKPPGRPACTLLLTALPLLAPLCSKTFEYKYIRWQGEVGTAVEWQPGDNLTLALNGAAVSSRHGSVLPRPSSGPIAQRRAGRGTGGTPARRPWQPGGLAMNEGSAGAAPAYAGCDCTRRLAGSAA